MRLHDESDPLSSLSQSAWPISVGDGDFAEFEVGSVVNQTPQLKDGSGIDIPGSSGTTDLIGTNGRVFFQNKTITITLAGYASFDGMEEIESILAPYQGRMIDFTFDDVYHVEYFQTGRVSISSNRNKNRIILTVDALPYRFAAISTRKTLQTLDNYETVRNTDAWTHSWSGASECIADDSVTNFSFSVDRVGAQIQRVKTVGGNSGYFAFGVKSIVGGNVWFEWQDGNKTVKSRSLAKVTPLAQPVQGGAGTITMMISVDGSYYEWKTLNGSRVYLPTVKCEYILSNYLPLDSNGEPDATVSDMFDSNVVIHPYAVLTVAQRAFVISDGVAAEIQMRGAWAENEPIPRFSLPNLGADRSDVKTNSVFAVVPYAAGQTPSVSITYRKAEVF